MNMADLFDKVLTPSVNDATNVEDYKFEDLPPIKGFPELRWRGKLPYNRTRFFPAQLKEKYGQSDQDSGWLNKIFWGDNLQVMSHLLKQFRGKIDLVYIDPPFDSKADYKKQIELRGKKITNDHTAFEEKQYGDMWSNDEYLQFIYERLILIRELLSDKGSIYLHCDWHKSHHLRCIMDEVFGPDNFKDDITWEYQGSWVEPKTYFPHRSQHILYYVKTQENYTFNRIYEEEKTEKGVIKRWERFIKDGKIYADNAPYGDGKFEPYIKKFIKENGRSPQSDDIIAEFQGRSVGDVWYISMLNPISPENSRYPTQKPEALLERIIKASSNEGDLVFDCFMGSGTTQAVAMKLGRRFIGADINLGAIETTTKRLNDILKADPAKTGFEVYNVNNYEVFRNPIEAKKILIDALEIEPLDHNTVFDGEKDGYKVKVMPINRIANRQDLNDIIQNIDYAALERNRATDPTKPAEKIELVCMGHEPDLGPELQTHFKNSGFDVDLKVYDILRNDREIEFKRQSEANIVKENGQLVIKDFFPMNLLQKLSMQKEEVTSWQELVDSVKIDWNYDGVVFEPTTLDCPEKKTDLVSGVYSIPADAGHIKIKITDLLSESFETEMDL